MNIKEILNFEKIYEFPGQFRPMPGQVRQIAGHYQIFEPFLPGY